MTPPSFLYKYQPVTEYTLINLCKHQIWFTKPVDLNDVYDCAIYPKKRVPTEEELAQLLPILRQKISDQDLDPRFQKDFLKEQLANDEITQWSKEIVDRYGVACFSDSMDNLLLWAHYTNGYKGICLKFDTSFEPFPKAEIVNYSPTIPLVFTEDSLLRPEYAVRQMVMTKPKCWEYEREWRILGKGDSPTCYQPECLTSVYFGVRTNETDKCLVRNLLKDSPVTYFETKTFDDQYGLIPSQIPC